MLDARILDAVPQLEHHNLLAARHAVVGMGDVPKLVQRVGSDQVRLSPRQHGVVGKRGVVDAEALQRTV